MKLGPDGLLWYDARYSVLICRECEYAIQKSAIQSHLLRHKIYRDERRGLLAAIAELEILEPEDVPLPPARSPPIHGISIVSGYRCLVSSCGHLCASSKRMKGHHSEIHGQAKSSDFESSAQEVQLQTFFRGNKLRYFEVTAVPTRSNAVVGGNNAQKSGGSGQRHEENVQAPESQALAPDLETLRYFHHFTTEIMLTLPSIDDSADSGNYWTELVVPFALQHQYLMSGLLAIAACHLAALHEPLPSSHGHRQRSAAFAVHFFNTWKGSNWDTSISTDVAKAGTQVACILTCISWTSPELTLDMSDIEAPGLHSASTTAPRTLGARHRRISNLQRPPSSAPSDPADERLNQLHGLTSRMAEALGRPENIHDVLVTLEAIAALIECCELGYSSDGFNASWQTMIAWPAMVAEHFHGLVSADSTAALVVVAHWAAFLVQPVEDCGCWFLRGAAAKMLRVIREQLIQCREGPEVLLLLP
ncbi:hypothetical protein BJY00DRAFT_300834 [Aspergillus carlsbadensis]|nr:hypothetical protein BJY00DRAFT_300834 [Aspergillus carlsbadensis]